MKVDAKSDGRDSGWKCCRDWRREVKLQLGGEAGFYSRNWSRFVYDDQTSPASRTLNITEGEQPGQPQQQPHR